MTLRDRFNGWRARFFAVGKRCVPILSRVRWRVVFGIGLPLCVLLALAVVFWLGTGVFEVRWPAPEVARTAAVESRNREAIIVERDRLIQALADLAPRGRYLVVDQTNNRLYLKEGEQVLHEAVCSAGSGMILRDSEKGRRWVFDTPRGVFQVQKKVKNPVWKKPDWAFIEEGKRPPARASERLEYGTLGEYALYLGDGYMIHGTLYERLLGRSVTHGCIRLGKEDLRIVAESVDVGTEVYIF